ncbi:MAG: hypothetical protein ACYYKD_12590 [Rhodospirillales bacterium]
MNRRRSTLFRILPVLAAALLAAGCAQNIVRNIDRLAGEVGKRSVLVMPADVLLAEVSAGGTPVINVAWTETGQKNVSAALKDFLAARGVNLITFESRPEDDSSDSTVAQIQKLHGAVSRAARAHGPTAPQPARLPHKDGRFDWTLGPSVAVLRERHQADYILFVSMEDTYTSAGRFGVTLALWALGVQMQMGTLNGFATLADARTGDVVWFRDLPPVGDIQLRDPASASRAIEFLLADFPK